MNERTFAERMDAARWHIERAEAHWDNYKEVVKFDAFDASIEYQLARDCLRIANVQMLAAGAPLIVQLAAADLSVRKQIRKGGAS